MKRHNIQILRIAACFGVFIVHLGQRLEPCATIRFFTDYGAKGAYLFFLISGYVSFLSFERTHGGLGLLKYYVTRLARILPVYYVVILYQFLLHTFILRDVPVDETRLGWKRYIFCISKMVPAQETFWTNLNSTWTIGAFLVFYLSAPLLYRCIRNFNTALLGWVISYLLSFCLNYYLPGYFEPVKQMQYFLFGIVIYYIDRGRKINQGLVFYMVNIFFVVTLTSDWRNDVWMMVFGLLVMCSRNLHISNGLLYCCISCLDDCSYSVYLIHVTVMEYVDRWKLSHTINWRMQAFMIIILGSITGTFLVHNLVERPVYYLARKYAREENGISARQIYKKMIKKGGDVKW